MLSQTHPSQYQQAALKDPPKKLGWHNAKKRQPQIWQIHFLHNALERSPGTRRLKGFETYSNAFWIHTGLRGRKHGVQKWSPFKITSYYAVIVWPDLFNRFVHSAGPGLFDLPVFFDPCRRLIQCVVFHAPIACPVLHTRSFQIGPSFAPTSS